MENTAVSNLGNIGLIFASAAAPLTLVTLALFIRWRTGSFLTVFSRMWTFFHGKGTASVPFIKNHLDSLTAVMQLNFSIGTRIRTEQHAKRVIQWCERHDESLLDAARCGRQFDWELPGLKEPFATSGAQRNGASFATFIALIVLAAAFLSIALYDRALLQLKASGTIFSLSADSAQPLWSDDRLIFAQCGTVANPSTSGFSPSDAKIICDAFGKKEEESDRAKYVSKTLAEQRSASLILCLMSFALTYLPFKIMSDNQRAKEMRDRLRSRSRSRTENEPPDEDANAA